MEAKNYFFRLSYEQYKKGKTEERARWEEEIFSKVLACVKEENPKIKTAAVDSFLDFLHQLQLNYSNSLVFEQIIREILKKEENETVARVIKNCWVAQWDYLEKKNACVLTEEFIDGSYLIRITSELVVNLSRMAWLYTTTLLLNDITPYADFSDRIFLTNLSKKLVKDLKDDTDEGTMYLADNSPSLEVTKILASLTHAYYDASIVFVIMHEVGHILELNDEMCNIFELVSSKKHTGASSDERIRISENNADYIANLYSDQYIGASDFFNVGPLLVMLTMAVNHKQVSVETDHPSIKMRYEKLASRMFRNKHSREIKYTRKILESICNVLQDVECWSEEEKDWWTL